MIKSVCFLPRVVFEQRPAGPNEVCVSIGDPDQEEPSVLADYVHALRLQFLDLEPNDCWKSGISHKNLFSCASAQRLIRFVYRMHVQQTPFDVIVHCEAGVSRSAAVALYIQAATSCELITRDASLANPWVVDVLLDADPTTDVVIPETAIEDKGPMPGIGGWFS